MTSVSWLRDNIFRLKEWGGGALSTQGNSNNCVHALVQE